MFQLRKEHLNSLRGMEKLQIYLDELGGLVNQILIGLTIVDSASLSLTMLFAPFTVCEAFSRLSKVVHSAMKYWKCYTSRDEAC